jgi:hypothetical protein
VAESGLLRALAAGDLRTMFSIVLLWPLIIPNPVPW